MVGRRRPEVNRTPMTSRTTAHLLVRNQSVYSRSPKTRKENTMKVGDVYTCEDCGAELTVTKACDCEDCQPKCCDKPLRLKGEEPAAPKGGCCCS